MWMNASRTIVVLVLACILNGTVWASETLEQVLVARNVPLDPANPHLLLPITSFADTRTENQFIIAYYLDHGSGTLESPLSVAVLDLKEQVWRRSEITREQAVTGTGRTPVGCLGSVTRIFETARWLELVTHLTPSASCTLLLAQDLSLQAALYGWPLATFADGRVVLRESMAHFAKGPARLAMYYPGLRSTVPLHPRKPYGPERLAHIEYLRRRWTGEWCGGCKHHCDIETFESEIRYVVISEKQDALAFWEILVDPDIEFDPPGGPRVFYVYRGLTDAATIEFGELTPEQVRKSFGDSLNRLLEPESLGSIFGDASRQEQK